MADESSVGICGGKSKPKINFLPQVDTTPEMSYEISERELFRCLLSDKTAKEIGDTQDNETSKILKDIDLKSKITQVETHKSQNVGQIESENIFVVFHIGEEDGGHWWSLEESAKSVTMQRSHEETAVKNQFKGKHRHQVVPIAERLQGKGSIKDFFILLWIHSVMDLKCQSFLSRCESFIPLVMKELTETYYEYPSNYFTYSALSSEEINPQLEEIVNLLTKVTKWHPLLCLTYLGDIQRFNQVLGKGFFKNKIDGIYNKLTLLNSAILFNKKEMVKHLLEKKKANARIRDKAGRNALNMAALFTDEEEIIKLILIFTIKVDTCDKSGMTALHYAVISSNLTVARHLINHGADFKRLDPTGHSPLHLAAHYAKDSQILDLLLTKVEIDECDSDGITALHSAAIASNAVSTCYLIERGADTNHRDISGRTPVHVAAAFAKNVDFFKIFLTNEKADFECCDKQKLTVLDYAKINQHGLANEIVSCIEKKINDKRSEYSLAKKTAGVQPYTGDEYKQTSIFGNLVENITGGIHELGQYFQKYLGGKYKQKLLFVPDANNEPDVVHEISEPALFRFLLNEETSEEFKGAEAEIPDMLKVLKYLDKESKITQVEMHQSSIGMIGELHGVFHVFIVFKTTRETDGDCWWSLERSLNHIVLQRSRNKDDVKNKLLGKQRIKVKSIKEDLKGKGTIIDLFAILWAQQRVIPEKYNIIKSNCQNFVTFVSKQMTQKEYEFEGVFPYSPPPEKGRDKKMLDLINVIRGSSDWSPLFHLIKMGNTDLVDKAVASGKYDINAFYKGQTPLHIAIRLKKTKMVQHLLKPPINADPTTRDSRNGRSALLVAAMFTMKAEIFDLLLEHDKVNVDDVDGNGRTALHLAASVSNVIAVQKLLENGANPYIFDNKGQSPLQMAVQQRDGNIMIDLLLEAQKVKGLGDVNDRDKEGWTALHYAAYASNEITAEHLIQKGADVNHRNNIGLTPLDMAALGAEDMKIIDLLLQNITEGDIQQYRNDKRLFFFTRHNKHGLEVEIGERFLKKGIKPPSTETDVEKCFQEIDEILKEEKFDVNGRDQNGETLLFSAICANNETGVRRLLERGADPTIRDNKGFTPFHVAVINDRDCEILKLLLANENVDINETTSEQGWTALHVAIFISNKTAARFLLSKGANPNVADENGATPLHVAAMFAKDMDIVELLLKHEDVDVNRVDNAGRNALDFARENKNGLGKRIANLLKKKGVVETENELHTIYKGMNNIHSRIFSNQKPDEVENIVSDDTISIEDKISKILESKDYLVSAIQDSDVETLGFLLKNGADNKTWGEEGAKILHLASFHAKTTDLIDVILETDKFDINGGDIEGVTPLHYAISGINYERNVPHLIRKGADPTIADKEGNTALHFAASHTKTIETINLILENEQVNINYINTGGETALHKAIVAKNVEIVRCLLEKGADPTIHDHTGYTPFHFAAYFLTDTDVLGLMLKTGKVDINVTTSKQGLTALHLEIIKSNVPAVCFLLSKGANPNVADENGITPLHLAVCCAKDIDIVELLLNHPDTNVNCLDNEGRNALDYAKDNMHGHGEQITKLLKEKDVASQSGNSLDDEKVKKEITSKNNVKKVLLYAIENSDVEKVRILIEKGAEISTLTWGEEEMNALHMASIYAKKTELLDVILATGQFDINGSNLNGMTALFYASSANNMTTARYLLGKGADPAIGNIIGTTPFHMAAIHSNNTDILALLLTREKKIEIDKVNESGLTALYVAIETSNVTAARFLLSKGANPNVADENGLTPLHWATRFTKDMEIVELLLNHKDTNVNLLDSKGNTALHYAMDNMHGEEIANLLREKMAAKAEGNNHEPENIGALAPDGSIEEDWDIKTIRLLMEIGQDISAMTWGENGANALHLAAFNEKTTDVIDAILETGKFNINGVDNDGRAPLHYAIMGSNPITINARRLIKMGANPNIADKNGVTPLHIAARNAKTMDLIELLLNTEAVDVNCVDNQGRTPLVCARDNKQGLGQRIIARLKECDEKEGVPLSIKLDRSVILGKGAYGIVFEGKWRNRKVAVKRIQIEYAENNKGGEEALQKLDHPNVVKLFHVESDSDFRYYALELCQLSLYQLFHGTEAQKSYRDKMAPENKVFLQLAKGLAYIHEKGLIHRNIKPENVLIWVDSTGKKVVMKWADFGLSKQVNERGSHSISGVRGTHNWMAPEILKIMTEENDRKTTSPNIHPRGTVKCDVYTAGLVFGYYLLGGDHPFGSAVNVLPNIVRNRPVNMTKIKEHPMHAIIMEMLKANPNERISLFGVVFKIIRKTTDTQK